MHPEQYNNQADSIAKLSAGYGDLARKRGVGRRCLAGAYFQTFGASRMKVRSANAYGYTLQAVSLRLMSPANPASPLPSSRKLEGSGVAVLEELSI